MLFFERNKVPVRLSHPGISMLPSLSPISILSRYICVAVSFLIQNITMRSVPGVLLLANCFRILFKISIVS